MSFDIATGSDLPARRHGASSSGHPGVLTKDSFQQLTGQMNEVLDNDEYANIRIEEGRVIDESISDETDNSMEGNAKVAEEESKSAEAAENSVNYQNILDYRNGLAKQICKYGKPKCYKKGQFFTRCASDLFLFGCQNIYQDDQITQVQMWGTFDSPGCGANYQGSDPHILTQLPRWVQEAFPAYLTTQAAVDKLVIDQMKPCFTGRFGPDPFSKMLRELQMLQHSRRELMYLSAAASYGLAGPDQVPSFPAFDDPMKYAGSAPSTHFVKCIWTDYQSGVKIYLDQIMASLSGFKLAGDHTFRIMKATARLKSEPIFATLFSLVNEWEEIRAHNGLKKHGHPPTSLYFCDNPPAERVTESLKDRVQHVAVNPFHRFASFEIMFTETVEFYSDPVLINNSCEAILKLLDALPPSETLIVALATYSDPGSHELLNIGVRLSMPELGVISHKRDGPVLDLGKLAKVKGTVQDPSVSFSSLVPAILKKRVLLVLT
ncbi:hypothetical protein BDP27DRAFT_1361229 [Rhodocollybia butyracea]|uniref:DUF6729 domain-containing protein n=1 Tax=Rhodocollybia butyracea TaxID=206335 RepID=A0A9P5U9N6_9AGAR|nr:hypothetical protein BDP27DRAFT_1361229 [Rhodocollybia butyracea]